MSEPATAFYCVTDKDFFLGAVAMINSLRLQGHAEPIYLLDCGLTPEQRRLVATEVTVIAAPDDASPHLLKTVAPLAHPAEVMVLIDADMIITRHLGELIETARQGRIVAFCNNVDRFVAEWGELLGLGPSRKQPYLCSGFVATHLNPGLDVLGLMEAHRDAVDFDRTWWRRDEDGYPFLFADQDLLNAILTSDVDAERITMLPCAMNALTPFEGLEVLDARSLRCVFRDGTEPYLLHHILPGKPWINPTPDGPYSQLLSRLLGGAGLAIRPDPAQVPRRLRAGLVAWIERKRADAWLRFRWQLGVRRARVRSSLRRRATR